MYLSVVSHETIHPICNRVFSSILMWEINKTSLKFFFQNRENCVLCGLLSFNCSHGHKDREQSQNVNKASWNLSVQPLYNWLLVSRSNLKMAYISWMSLFIFCFQFCLQGMNFLSIDTVKPKTSLEILGSEIQRMCISCGFPKVHLLVSTENCS